MVKDRLVVNKITDIFFLKKKIYKKYNIRHLETTSYLI